ncbi:hypothetical protein [Coleofasciculus sp. E1-EBD-02]|uniref:hypothetical protein n=1 Tax=Coleofasciculus sp. E1-EBD-02 TaxID=3068481 RepID=UPI0032F445F9
MNKTIVFSKKLLYNLSVLLIVLTSCQEKAMVLPAEVATVEKPAISPSEKYTLVIENHGTSDLPYREFKILDQEQNLVYTSSEQFDIRHTTYFLWGADDRVWVYSGDIGTFFWENEPDTKKWQQHVYARSDVPAPSYLKDQRPRLHQR